MRVTRSATRAAALATDDTTVVATEVTVAKTTKRKAPAKTTARKKARTADDADAAEPSAPAPPAPKAPTKHIKPVPSSGGAHAMVPAELTFSFEEAKEHLIKADSRFEDIFDRLGCRPFEQLERVDPFRYV